MGDINFNIEKNVDLNKNVNLQIDKNVNANVDNEDLLATSETDAEAFGENALAETDAFTYVNSEPGEPGEPVLNPGSIDVLGNIDDLVIGDDGDDDDELADTIEIVFDSAGDPPPDVDDINGFGSLASLSAPPPGQDTPLPDPLLSVTDLNLTQTGEIIEPLVEGLYTNDADWVVNFGERTLDLDGDGTETTDELLFTVPEGSLFLADFSPPGPEIEVIFEGFAADNPGFFTFDGVDYPTTGFVTEFESLQIGATGDWAFEAASNFGGAVPPIPGEGEAFSYGESTAALDLNGDGGNLV
ncbi:hypothetical protein IQ255_01960 [Pleurocapsales cyanobacterium LEGE 10410]|nr:hypothetical protein [Pleurocapsales cyanobacterium LEGE 10410]